MKLNKFWKLLLPAALALAILFLLPGCSASPFWPSDGSEKWSGNWQRDGTYIVDVKVPESYAQYLTDTDKLNRIVKVLPLSPKLRNFFDSYCRQRMADDWTFLGFGYDHDGNASGLVCSSPDVLTEEGAREACAELGLNYAWSDPVLKKYACMGT